ncbi:hypothetical protein BU14_0419s0009 [Porphyra umbilicalis]|uniref:Uncharacterized protein n=1 Tax=Porphyra umbilicalis TaxID=2786 RepID=A0A1X6NW58_PORUM|nr:hypothetical protein BU14_0419s0009 [Porphyra umbilicalis]|eukprot:OSX72603.1 hypothetical protein BU14_0419s0009 [Porphyra umbilicalis]
MAGRNLAAAFGVYTADRCAPPSPLRPPPPSGQVGPTRCPPSGRAPASPSSAAASPSAERPTRSASCGCPAPSPPVPSLASTGGPCSGSPPARARASTLTGALGRRRCGGAPTLWRRPSGSSTPKSTRRWRQPPA